MCTQASSATYKYQGRVQILVAFLYELLIVLVRFILIIFIELSAKICLIRRIVLSPASWGFNGGYVSGMEQNLPKRRSFALGLIFIPLWFSSDILAGFECQII